MAGNEAVKAAAVAATVDATAAANIGVIRPHDDDGTS